MNKFSISSNVMASTTTTNTTTWTKALGIDFLTQLYSKVLEQELSTSQTLHLLHVQTAAFITFCSFAGNIAIIALCIAWFGMALWQCKQCFSAEDARKSK